MNAVGGVPEGFADNLGVDARHEERRGEGVAQVMQADALQADLGAQPPECRARILSSAVGPCESGTFLHKNGLRVVDAPDAFSRSSGSRRVRGSGPYDSAPPSSHGRACRARLARAAQLVDLDRSAPARVLSSGGWGERRPQRAQRTFSPGESCSVRFRGPLVRFLSRRRLAIPGRSGGWSYAFPR